MSAKRNPEFRKMKRSRAPRVTSKAAATPPSGTAKAAAPPPPGERAPTYEDLLAIARLVEAGSRFSEFRLRSGDIEVEVKRAPTSVPGTASAPASPAAVAQASPAAVAPSAPAPASATAAPPAATPAAAIPELPPGTELVRSPMAGTVYRSPLPGSPHFVDPGSRVERDTIVCIVEVMKLMNSIPAGYAGVVSHVLVENAQPVEPGQPLFAIRTAP